MPLINPLLNRTVPSIMQGVERSQRAELVRKTMAYSRTRLSHAKEIYYIVCIVLLVVITLFSIWGPGGYLELKKARREFEAQRARVEVLKRSNQERMQAIQALRSDKEALERLARENGYGKPGEIVLQLPEQTKPKADAKKR